MAENCKNCNEVIAGNFCINCGQKKYKRIDRKYVLDEIEYTFLHVNKGLLFSAKNILKNPGKTAKEFIDGNRVNHYKPILLAFVLSGISTFLSFKVIGLKEIMGEALSKRAVNAQFMNNYMAFLSNYSSILSVAMIPFFALTTKIAFRRWGHNYYEHVVMNAYFLSFYTLLNIIFLYPVLFFFRHHDASLILTITQCFMLLIPFLLVWFFKEFYSDRTLKSVIVKVLVIIALVILAYLILIIIAVVVGIIYAIINGPETLKQFKPTAIN
jgi:Protein of unknown function (DUF3667)